MTFEIPEFELAKIAKIYESGFVMFFVILGLQELFLYSQLKLLAHILLGFAIYSGMIRVLKTFSKYGLDFIMLLIRWLLQKASVVILLLFL